MAISHLIAHRIQRLTPSTGATLQLREADIERDGKIEECCREMKLCFIKKLSKNHGKFSNDMATHPMSSWLKECTEERLGYVSFTHKAMQHFKLCLDKGEALIDAFVFFVQESFEHGDELSIYIVDHQNAQYIDGNLTLQDSLYLNSNTINLAAKINLREWLGDDEQVNYLSVLIWRGEKELSDAFSEFTGFSDKVDIKEDTEAFLEVVDTYTKALPEEEAVETRERVVNYCMEQDKAGERVLISELSSHINEEDEKAFEKHLFEQKPHFKRELIPDRPQLRQYIRISGRDDLLSMSFDSKCLGETVVYDAESDSLVIHKIPSALKTKLMQHMRKT